MLDAFFVSEYMMWSFTETNTGTVVLQHEKIPTIRIHIEADFARKAEERSTPLLFVEESAIDGTLCFEKSS